MGDVPADVVLALESSLGRSKKGNATVSEKTRSPNSRYRQTQQSMESHQCPRLRFSRCLPWLAPSYVTVLRPTFGLGTIAALEFRLRKFAANTHDFTTSVPSLCVVDDVWYVCFVFVTCFVRSLHACYIRLKYTVVENKSRMSFLICV